MGGQFGAGNGGFAGAEGKISIVRHGERDCPDLLLWETVRPCQTHGVIDPFIEPGVLVRHPRQDDWGLGQVQTVVGARVTVNFEHAGKQLIDTNQVRLTYVGRDPRE